MNPLSIPERFEILEEVGVDASERVLRARDRVLDREVFLKQLVRSAYDTLGRDRGKCLREAKALAKVRHPGVVQLFDVLESRVGPLLIFDPVPGEPLSERLKREGRLPPAEVRRIGSELCDALSAVHAAGIVHRGIAATSVILRPDGTLCLAGFSFAKTSSTALSSIDYMGKSGKAKPESLPAHPAPEQIAGRAADARSDIFGVGCVLYECLTGQPPFAGGASTDPRTVYGEAPADLSATIAKCLAPSPIGRFQTAAALQEAVARGALPPAGRRSLPRALLASGVVAAGLALLWTAGVFGPGAPTPPWETTKGGGIVNRPRPPHAPRPRYTDDYENSFALLIGLSYAGSADWRELRNAKKDVRDVASALRGLGKPWQVETLDDSNATRTRICNELYKLRDTAGPNDRVFVYFAGHGIRKYEESAYVIPAGVRRGPDEAEYVRFIEFERFVQDTKAKHVLVSLDCCYSGKLAQQTRSGSGPGKFAREHLTRKARMILASGRANQEVPDGKPGENSPFARAFLSALRDREKDTLIGSELYAHIVRGVHASGSDQRPAMKYYRDPDDRDDSGEFVFFLKK